MADPAGALASPSGNGELRAGAVLSKLSWGLVSDPGPSRSHNEDFAGAYAPTTPDDAWTRPPLFALADGMGGHAAGEVASRTAVESLIDAWGDGNSGSTQASLRSAARAANTAVVDAGLEPGRRGMGTTLTAVAVCGTEAVVGHVGDSRAYLVRGDACDQLTTDHSRVAEMVRMKIITAEQAADHPARSQITRSLGGDPFVQVDLSKHPIQQHDVVILCCDGLWDVVLRSDLVDEARLLVAGITPTPVDAAERLVSLAVKRETTDNVTAVVVHITSNRPIPPVSTRRSLFRRNRP
jgi:serine/threonine protein phosphatase PrpC